MAEQRFFSIDDLTQMPPPIWAIEGMFEKNSLVMLAGPSGIMKSFLAIDWTMCMSSGRKWKGRKTLTQKCLYCLGEGKANLLKRLQAWELYEQLSDEEKAQLRANFRVTFDVPQLSQKASVDNLLAQLKADGFAPDVIVIDTFARSFVGMDENDAKDTGLWIEQADRLRQLGYTVIFLHHTTKNTEFGHRYRGSTAIMGAMDTAMQLTKDTSAANRLQLEVTKQKDHDEGPPLFFSKLILGGADGSCVLVPTVKVDERYTEEGQKIERIVDEILDDDSLPTKYAKGNELARRTGLKTETAISRMGRRMETYKRKEPDGHPDRPRDYSNDQQGV